MVDKLDGLWESHSSGKARHKKKSDGQNAPTGGVHLFLPPGPVIRHSPSLVTRFLMAVNRKLPKNRKNFDPGLKGKTKIEGQSHLKRLWNDSQPDMKFWIQNRPVLTCAGFGSNIAKFRKFSTRRRRSDVCRIFHIPGERLHH